ncbi:hypothetical protein [Hanstruepera marina]|uniref:hypothetical protein n=1 Tax=Hanstruepera marina TaxID=2873265 RepID=UPI001CA78E7A|nr:hypothetical protein [Hanstruepera marina]
MKKLLFIFCLSLLLFNCQNDDDNQENSIVPEETCEMQFDDLGLTEAHAIVIPEQHENPSAINDNTPWKARYSENIVELSYERGYSPESHGNVIFVFKKINNCIKFDYRYEVVMGGITPSINRVYEYFTEHDFIIQEYIPDEKLVGRLIGEYDGEIHNIDFWIDFTTDDFFIEEVPDYISFQNCLGSQLPMNIDINNDGVDDFKFTRDEQFLEDPAFPEIIPILRNIIVFEADNNNTILAGTYNLDLPVFTENLDQSGRDEDYVIWYTDFIHESIYPYKQFNFWTRGYTNEPYNLSTLTNIHYAIKMMVNGEPHYGYINFSILGNDCEIIIHETYLNPTPNEHIIIE